MLRKMNKILVFLFSLLFLTVTLGSSHLLLVGKAAMLFCIVVVVADYLRDRTFRLIHVWHLAFMYIVVSEMILSASELDHHPYGRMAANYIVVGNLLLYFGYLFSPRFSSRGASSSNGKRESVLIPKVHSLYLIFILALVFLAYSIPLALSTLSMGRVTDGAIRSVDNLLIDNFMLSLGLILPTMGMQVINVNEVGRTKLWTFRLITIVIFAVFLLLGTRYYVLFSLGGYLIAANRDIVFNLRPRKFIVILSLIVIMGGILNSVKDIRIGGLGGEYTSKVTSSDQDVFSAVASVLSPEGVIKLNADAIDYFQRHDNLYGMSSGFLFYFWIPRSIWPDKPKMIGYWLVREYEDESGFSEGYSASVGFFGDLYADFHYFVFPILFALGVALRKVERTTLEVLRERSSSLVLACMAYPAVFFFVRSPITTLTNLIGMYLAFLLVRFLIYRKLASKA